MADLFDYVQTHYYEDWSWAGLSQNPNITLYDIEAHPRQPWYAGWRESYRCNWDYWSMSSNPNLTMAYVEAHIGEKWDWIELAKHPWFTYEFFIHLFTFQTPVLTNKNIKCVKSIVVLTDASALTTIV
jgi:hypothetical protein